MALSFFKRSIPLCVIAVFAATLFAAAQGSSNISDMLGTGKPTPKIEKEAAERPTLETAIRKIQDYTLMLNEVSRITRQEFDTAAVMEVLPGAEQIVFVVEERLSNADDNVNLRYLKALENLLASIRNQVLRIEKEVNYRADALVEARVMVDSIKGDNLMQYALRDTALLPEYQTSFINLNKYLQRTDSTLSAERLEAAAYKSRIGNLSGKIAEINDRLQVQKRKLERALFKKETNYLWQPSVLTETPSLAEVFRDSARLNYIILTRYTLQHIEITLALVLLWLALYFAARRNLRVIRGSKEFASIIVSRTPYVPRYPLISAAIMVLAVAPLIYPNRPVVFSGTAIILLVTLTGIVQRRRISKRLLTVYFMLYLLLVLSTVSNLFWEVTYQERWYLLLLGLSGIGLAFVIVRLAKDKELKMPSYLPTIATAYLVLQGLALIANSLGRFSLAKSIGVTSSISLMHGLGLIVFVLIIKEFVYLQFEVSRKSENEYTSYLDFDSLQKRILGLFSFLAIAIWIFHFIDNLSAVDFIFSNIQSFLTEKRTVMNATFTWGSIVVFFVVIYVAYFLAKNIAFFAALKDNQGVARNKRLGSTALLVRLAVIIIGFIIAVALSGMELDKVALVLGALSVGIGFGLQSIVNNVVSGIILAFERPIQVGDSVLVGSMEGIVLEIGIRASKIKNWDGAEVIIPNGDLLSQALVNWTLSDKQRRVELSVGVAYGTDVDIATRLITEQLQVDGILEKPARKVYLQAFGDSAINFRVLFWVRDFDLWLVLRDEVMRGIHSSFRQHGIQIPFPQRDLHIKSMPDAERSQQLASPGEPSGKSANQKADETAGNDKNESTAPPFPEKGKTEAVEPVENGENESPAPPFPEKGKADADEKEG